MKNTEYAAARATKRCPTHPGAILREDVLPAVERPKAEIARLLRISRQQLYDILDEKRPLSPQIAVRVAAMFGGNTETWVRMQAAYDAWHAERDEDVSDIPRLTAA